MSDVDQCRLEILTSVATERAAIRAAARQDQLCGYLLRICCKLDL